MPKGCTPRSKCGGGCASTEAHRAKMEEMEHMATHKQELISGAEVARKLGISRQRVTQLAAAANSQFPKPIARVGYANVYDWADVEKWHKNRPARPQPAKAADAKNTPKAPATKKAAAPTAKQSNGTAKAGRKATAGSR